MARGDRPALSGGADAARRAVEAVWRIESARIVGALTRYTGDFGLAEDVAQEALAEALAFWPQSGVPENPGAWLLTTARRRAIDAFRRRAGRDTRYATLARDLSAGSPRTDHDVLWDPDSMDDDILALMFISCHPVLSREARIALDAAYGWWPHERRDRPGVPHTGPDRSGTDHPRQEKSGRGARAVCRARPRGPWRAARLGAQCAVCDLHGGFVGNQRR